MYTEQPRPELSSTPETTPEILRDILERVREYSSDIPSSEVWNALIYDLLDGRKTREWARDAVDQWLKDRKSNDTRPHPLGPLTDQLKQRFDEWPDELRVIGGFRARELFLPGPKSPPAWIPQELFRIVDLSYQSVTTQELERLINITTIQTLNLKKNNIGDEGARVLAGNTTIQTLNLEENNIGDEGAKALAGNTTIQTLNLRYTYIGDEGARALAENNTLTTLYLGCNNIGDEGARAFENMKQLRRLDLSGTGVSHQTMEQLRKKLPNCKITRNL